MAWKLSYVTFGNSNLLDLLALTSSWDQHWKHYHYRFFYLLMRSKYWRYLTGGVIFPEITPAPLIHYFVDSFHNKRVLTHHWSRFYSKCWDMRLRYRLCSGGDYSAFEEIIFISSLMSPNGKVGEPWMWREACASVVLPHTALPTSPGWTACPPVLTQLWLCHAPLECVSEIFFLSVKHQTS